MSLVQAEPRSSPWSCADYFRIILFSLYGSGPVKAEATLSGIDAAVSKEDDVLVLIGKAHELLHIT